MRWDTVTVATAWRVWGMTKTGLESPYSWGERHRAWDDRLEADGTLRVPCFHAVREGLAGDVCRSGDEIPAVGCSCGVYSAHEGWILAGRGVAAVRFDPGRYMRCVLTEVELLGRVLAILDTEDVVVRRPAAVYRSAGVRVLRLAWQFDKQREPAETIASLLGVPVLHLTFDGPTPLLDGEVIATHVR